MMRKVQPFRVEIVLYVLKNGSQMGGSAVI